MNNDLIMLSCCVFSESEHAWLGIKCLIKRLVSVFDSPLVLELKCVSG